MLDVLGQWHSNRGAVFVIFALTLIISRATATLFFHSRLTFLAYYVTPTAVSHQISGFFRLRRAVIAILNLRVVSALSYLLWHRAQLRYAPASSGLQHRIIPQIRAYHPSSVIPQIQGLSIEMRSCEPFVLLPYTVLVEHLQKLGGRMHPHCSMQGVVDLLAQQCSADRA